MLGLIENANDATFWGALNGPGTRVANSQLAPPASRNPAKCFSDMKSLVMSAKASTSDVEVHFEITTDSIEEPVML
jgi:hypothetical protein